MSAPTTSDHQIQVQPRAGINTAAPADASFIANLNAALVGGDPVYEFFAGNFQALQNLYQTIATGGDEVWLDGVDQHTGLPVTYVAQGSNFLTVAHEYTDTQPLQDGTGSTTTYKPVGVSYVTFTTDQGTSQIILNDIHYAGLGLGALLTAPVLSKFALSIIKSVASWVKNTAIRIYRAVTGGGAEDPDQAEDTVENETTEAATESSETGVEVADGIFADVTITLAQGVLAVVGIGILAVVFILQLLEKQMTASVRFYNLTATDIPFGVCYTDSDTGMSGGPAAVGSTVPVPKVSPATAPPWVTGSDTGIYYGEATFVNQNELEGIGYVLTGDPSGSFPGFKVAVDIPLLSSNSMSVQFSTDSCSDVWTQLDDSAQPPTVLTASATSGPYTLTVATNAVSGTSPSPLTGEVGYFYEHLVVLTDGSVTGS